VDEIHVFYVSTPSHGTLTPMPCPETRIELNNIANKFDAVWWDCPHYAWEGEHRDFAVKVCMQRGADTILVVDADEIWNSDHLSLALGEVEDANIQNNLVYMRHFWRSLKWVCDDLAAPVRILRPKGTEGTRYSEVSGHVYHMGYAQTPEIIFYKQQIHGHKAEWRDGWFEDKFLAWKPGMGDVHPTNVDFWTPEQVDFYTYNILHQLCGDHPYFDLDLIMPTGDLASGRDGEQRSA
jgi:hypothetical protein